MTSPSLNVNLTNELVLNLKYQGCGWFRDNRVPEGTKATIVRATQLLTALKQLLENNNVRLDEIETKEDYVN